MTQRILDACGAIDVSVHDHVIIGKDQELSFRSEGLI
jgi:DNA repair protein RadC